MPSLASAQGAVITGRIQQQGSTEALSFATIAVLSQNRQFLADESGQFSLAQLPPGEVRLRFKRIGFTPRDTTFVVAAGDTARVRVEMVRLVLQLPTIVVRGKCTDTAPLEPKSAILAELFDQVQQNAERMKLLASERPFLMKVRRVRGYREGENRIIATRVDTITRRPMPRVPYEPKRVVRPGEGINVGEWVVALPELPDIADTAFTNNHCFSYVGQTRFGSDSVIEVAFEPIPRLAKDVDIQGTLYLRADSYQLVGSVTSLNRIPARFRSSGLEAYTVRARFSEIVSGVPVLEDWELTNRFRRRLPVVELGQVFFLQWTDSAARATPIDTVAGRSVSARTSSPWGPTSSPIASWFDLYQRGLSGSVRRSPSRHDGDVHVRSRPIRS